MAKERKTSRRPDIQQQYDLHRQKISQLHGDNPPCPFCNPGNRRHLDGTRTMLVLENNFPYEFFDGRYVKEHIMIVPRRHLGLMERFSADERYEYWQLMAKYHKLGYSSFTRSAADEKRSVPMHLHTHLFTYQD